MMQKPIISEDWEILYRNNGPKPQCKSQPD